MFKLLTTDSYDRQIKKFLKKHPDLFERYAKVLKLLSLNPSHPSLRLHKLKGHFSEIYSVSINISYRITLKFIVKKDAILLIDIGNHDEIY